MLLNRRDSRRCAATAVEFAAVGAVTFFLILALIIGGMGIFRYQEVAHLAREGSRYASTHGGQYHQDGIDTQTGVPQVASSSDLATYLQTKTVVLDPSALSVNVSWSAPAGYTPNNMPRYDGTDPNQVPPGQVVINNYVTVTVSYAWTPLLYLTGPITLTSTSTVQMSY
jgi:Flp pilus assembly protein TadG